MTTLEPTAPIPAPTIALSGAGSEPDPRRWRALGVLALMQFMLVLDITVVKWPSPTSRLIWASRGRG